MATPAQPLDGNYKPIPSVYDPTGLQFVAPQASTVATSSDGTKYAASLVQQVASSSANGTLQNAAAANGNGTALALLGNASVIFTVNMSGFTGTVNFEVTEDNTNWDPLQTQQEGTNLITTYVTGSTTTAIHLYEGSTAGLQSVRARISGYSAGTVTVTAHAIPVSDAPRVVNAVVVAQPTATTASAAVAANTSNSATLSAVAAQTNYITGFTVTTQGGTGAAAGAVTVTGVKGGTLTFEVGAAASNPVQFIHTFPQPLPASAVNTAIVVNVPALGANTGAAACTVYGYVL